jgi:hypothetical protein
MAGAVQATGQECNYVSGDAVLTKGSFLFP